MPSASVYREPGVCDPRFAAVIVGANVEYPTNVRTSCKLAMVSEPAFTVAIASGWSSITPGCVARPTGEEPDMSKATMSAFRAPAPQVRRRQMRYVAVPDDAAGSVTDASDPTTRTPPA